MANTDQILSPVPTTLPIMAGSSLDDPSLRANSRLAMERSTSSGIRLRVAFIYFPVNPCDSQPLFVLRGLIPVLNS